MVKRLIKREEGAVMLEVYEGYGPDRKLVRKIQGESVEIKAVHAYLIWLDLIAQGKVILMLYVSPHQLGRLGKYLADGKWRGGVICPQKSEPEGCDIVELNDQARYRQVLSDIERLKATLREYEAWPDMHLAALNADWYRKEISNLELEALMLRDSTRFGLAFQFVLARPHMEIEWLPEDRQAEAVKFLEAARLAYSMREPEPERKTDLTEWKRRLFDV